MLWSVKRKSKRCLESSGRRKSERANTSHAASPSRVPGWLAESLSEVRPRRDGASQQLRKARRRGREALPRSRRTGRGTGGTWEDCSTGGGRMPLCSKTPTPVWTRSKPSFKSAVLRRSHRPVEAEAQPHPEVPSSGSRLPGQPSLKDSSGRAVDLTLIPLIHPQPPPQTLTPPPPPPPCARGTCILFSNPQTSCIMQRVPAGALSARRIKHHR